MTRHHLSVPELQTDARLTPGRYPVLITARDLDGIGYHLWDELTIDGPTTYALEATSLPAATVTLTGEIEGDGTTRDLAVGGELQPAYQAGQDRHAPGNDVTFDGVLSDANGAPLRSVRRDVGGNWSAVLATVEVRDPSDALVSSTELQLFELYRADDDAVTLPPDAPLGSYQVEMTLETGPLSGTVVASDAFEVGAGE